MLDDGYPFDPMNQAKVGHFVYQIVRSDGMQICGHVLSNRVLADLVIVSTSVAALVVRRSAVQLPLESKRPGQS